MIQAKDLSVSYGKHAIISNLEFEANPTNITAIIGPNGSGKTTLLNALCGDLPYTGNITLNNYDIKQTPAWKLALERAVLPQFSSLTFPFTIREVVRLGVIAAQTGSTTFIEENLIECALNKVGLDGFAARNYQELSGGEQQRVQLARILCQVWEPVSGNSPRWLFLDEPVSSLDIQHQLKIMNVAKQYAANGGGVVAIMHDLNLTAMYADKIYLMKNGQVIASGSPQSVLQDTLLEDVFNCKLQVSETPTIDIPFVLPHTATI